MADVNDKKKQQKAPEKEAAAEKELTFRFCSGSETPESLSRKRSTAST